VSAVIALTLVRKEYASQLSDVPHGQRPASAYTDDTVRINARSPL